MTLGDELQAAFGKRLRESMGDLQGLVDEPQTIDETTIERILGMHAAIVTLADELDRQIMQLRSCS